LFKTRTNLQNRALSEDLTNATLIGIDGGKSSGSGFF